MKRGNRGGSKGRGNMRGFRGKKRKVFKKAGMERAAISALLVRNKSFSLQRLTHDYKEIKDQKIPIPYVSAVPLDDDMYEWHATSKLPLIMSTKEQSFTLKWYFPQITHYPPQQYTY